MTIQTLAAQLRAEVARLSATRAELITERNALTEERELLLNAPLNRDDTKSFMLAYVDMMAEKWNAAANWPSAIRDLTYPNRYPLRNMANRPGINEVAPLSFAEHEKILSGDKSAASSVLGSDGLPLVSAKFDGFRLNDSQIFALFGDLLKTKLAELFERFYTPPLAVDACRIGPPITERRARIAAIEQQLASLAERIAEIEKACSELGTKFA